MLRTQVPAEETPLLKVRVSSGLFGHSQQDSQKAWVTEPLVFSQSCRLLRLCQFLELDSSSRSMGADQRFESLFPKLVVIFWNLTLCLENAGADVSTSVLDES